MLEKATAGTGRLPNTQGERLETNRDKFSHSRRQLFHRSQTKKSKTLEETPTEDSSILRRDINNITHGSNHCTRQKFGFTPNTDLSVHMNARQALGQLHPQDYFSPINKLMFHNLTENNLLLPDTNLLLGLGLKFIPTSSINITMDNLDHTLACLEQDIGLCVYFAGDDSDDMYVPDELHRKSSWRAPILPLEINNRLIAFQRDLDKIFV